MVVFFTVAQFMHVLRQRIQLGATESIYLMVNGVTPTTRYVWSSLEKVWGVYSLWTTSGEDIALLANGLSVTVSPRTFSDHFHICQVEFCLYLLKAVFWGIQCGWWVAQMFWQFYWHCYNEYQEQWRRHFFSATASEICSLYSETFGKRQNSLVYIM